MPTREQTEYKVIFDAYGALTSLQIRVRLTEKEKYDIRAAKQIVREILKKRRSE